MSTQFNFKAGNFYNINANTTALEAQDDNQDAISINTEDQTVILKDLKNFSTTVTFDHTFFPTFFDESYFTNDEYSALGNVAIHAADATIHHAETWQGRTFSATLLSNIQNNLGPAYDGTTDVIILTNAFMESGHEAEDIQSAEYHMAGVDNKHNMVITVTDNYNYAPPATTNGFIKYGDDIDVNSYKNLTIDNSDNWVTGGGIVGKYDTLGFDFETEGFCGSENIEFLIKTNNINAGNIIEGYYICNNGANDQLFAPSSQSPYPSTTTITPGSIEYTPYQFNGIQLIENSSNLEITISTSAEGGFDTSSTGEISFTADKDQIVVNDAGIAIQDLTSQTLEIDVAFIVDDTQMYGGIEQGIVFSDPITT